MHAAFGTVLWIVLGVAAVIAVLALMMSSRTWSDFGRGGLVMDRDEARPGSGAGAATVRERDEDIRSMLEARNARRIRRGRGADRRRARACPAHRPWGEREHGQRAGQDANPGGSGEPAAAVDPELADEVRQLVVARNARRTRAGKPALDVEAELARELRRIREGFG